MGVRILLDTHVFLWWLFDDSCTPSGLKNLIKNIENEGFVSAASVWEIATKFRLGKLPRAGEVAENVPHWIVRAGFKPLNVTPAHAQLAGAWKVDHRDPFDRMLAAQAKIEDLALVSVDKSMALFPIKVIAD